MVPLARHPQIDNRVIVFDLAGDVDALLALEADAVAQRIFTAQASLPDGVVRLPVKEVHLNRCPALIAWNHLRPAEFERLQIDPAQLEDWKQTRTGAIVGETLAKQFGWKIGDTIPLQATIFPRQGSNDWPLQLVGIFRSKDRAAASGEERQLGVVDRLEPEVGALVAGVDEDGRTVPLDIIPSVMVGKVEVIKTVTPENDANAIGGVINRLGQGI